ncbi:MAG: hypothetical protein K2F71_04595, partial [Paramuribaculum sp.]|nr:hypothetical protein [Paramuribaculum sp.]
MKNLYRIFRSLVLILIGLILVVPPVVYIGLELDCVQNPVRKRAETELSKLLGVEVSIGSVSIAPFNRATLRDVTVTGPGADTIACIDRLGAGIDIYPLIVRGNLVVGYAELIGLDARIHRATPHSPTNIQPIIDALRPKKPRREPTRFDLAVNTIVIRRSQLTYDVDSIACDSSGRFSPHHAAVSDLRADIRIPRLRNNEIVITLNQLAFAERSGLTVEQ